MSIRSHYGKLLQDLKRVIQVDGDGNISSGVAVVFDEAFKNIPAAMAVKPLGANGTWGVSSVTATGCNITIVGATSLTASTDYEISVVARELY